MWILPTRGRPKNLARFIDVCKKTKTSTSFLIVLDHDDPSQAEYLAQELPEKWEFFTNNETLPVGRIFNKIFKIFPNEPFYGAFSDDFVPGTDYWDVKLIEAAGKDCIAWGDDGIRGSKVISGCAIGGNFVREMGYIFLPTLKHFYCDDWLTEVGKRRGTLRHLPEVKIPHYHFTNGLAEFDETYKRRDGSGDKEAYDKWLKDQSRVDPVTFVCVNSGNYLGRGVEYVNILFDMVVRNISDNIIFEFQVFTDHPEGYHEAIEVRSLPGNLSGWWNKLYLFKKELFNENDRIIFLDLDTIIVGGLDSLISYRGEFATLRDFWRPQGLGPAVIAWRNGGRANAIWDSFERLGYPQENNRGDQAYIENLDMHPDILQDLYPKEFSSYKSSCQLGIPKGTKVVCFHGLPRPHEITDGWVPNIWKIGGGSTIELEFVMNTDEEELKANVKRSFSMPHEHLADQYMGEPDGHIVICGGGPSLADHLDEIRWRSQQGQVVWALNNTFKYLMENDIGPDALIILDGRKENANFIPDKTKITLLLASQCHKDTFARAEASGGRIIIWHRYIDNLLEMAGTKRIGIVQSGTTVGMNAIGIAQLFGVKYVHLYGFDSSYREGKNHAYDQPLNNSERIIDVKVNDREFKCAPWMAAQVNEFEEAVNGFVESGMEFTIHDDGLFGYKATLLEQKQEL